MRGTAKLVRTQGHRGSTVQSQKRVFSLSSALGKRKGEKPRSKGSMWAAALGFLISCSSWGPSRSGGFTYFTLAVQAIIQIRSGKEINFRAESRVLQPSVLHPFFLLGNSPVTELLLYRRARIVSYRLLCNKQKKVITLWNLHVRHPF